MEFIPFLYANCRLGPPAGMTEAEVRTIDVFKGEEYITGCVQFNEAELAEIAKTGVVWLSLMAQKWPPARVEAYLPAHKPADIIVFGTELAKKVHVLAYLDLTLVLLEMPEEEIPVSFLHKPGAGNNGDGGKVDIFDLQYKVRTMDEGSGQPVISETKGGKYEFGEELRILGRFGELERLAQLKYIFPNLRDDLLVLGIPDKPKPPPLYNIQGDQIN